ETGVAVMAEQGPQTFRHIAMIEAEPPSGFLLADRAQPVLCRQLSLIHCDDGRIIAMPAPLVRPAAQAGLIAKIGVAAELVSPPGLQMIAVGACPGRGGCILLGPVLGILRVSLPMPLSILLFPFDVIHLFRPLIGRGPDRSALLPACKACRLERAGKS